MRQRQEQVQIPDAFTDGDSSSDQELHPRKSQSMLDQIEQIEQIEEIPISSQGGRQEKMSQSRLDDYQHPVAETPDGRQGEDDDDHKSENRGSPKLSQAMVSPLTNRGPSESAMGDALNEQFHVVSELAKLNKLRQLDESSALPLVKNSGSLAADMKMGWRPKNPYSGAPIPLYYEYESFAVNRGGQDKDFKPKEPIYLGPRVQNSLQIHKLFAKRELRDGTHAYTFKFPPRPPQIARKRIEEPRPFTGMNPVLKNADPETREKALVFDSFFESGNLDVVTQAEELEYNLFMRVDTNTRGHHQWFYFSVEHQEYFKDKKVTFNIMNFTKDESLYNSGMRVVLAKRSNGYKHERGGQDISYFRSRLIRRRSANHKKVRYYYQLRFSYVFDQCEDKVYFSYCYPYTFSKLQNFLREISHINSNPKKAKKHPVGKQIGQGKAEKTAPRDGASPKKTDNKKNDDNEEEKQRKPEHLQLNLFCKSLSGVDVPILTVTSRLQSDPREYNLVKLSEFDTNDSKVNIPLYKKKKYMIITGRVHPGESNSSFMMQGFIKSIMGNSLQARELRKRIIFKIVPMINVDGVIIGNYRTSMVGNDLNRRYAEPDPRLHPEICAIKELAYDLIYGKKPGIWPMSNSNGEPEVGDEDIVGFIDMHGHSRKKNVFIYGNQFSLSSEKYYRTRIIPKMLSEET